MTLNEIHAVLLARTRRVDRSDELRTSIRKAIRTVHSAAYFPQDIVEEAVQLGSAFTDFKVPRPPRMRKLTIAAPLDAQGRPVRLPTKDNAYELVDSADVIDSFHQRRSNICYMAGNAIVFKSSSGVSNLYLSFYALPEVSDNNLETWIMRDYEGIIIDATLSDFYLVLGQEQLAATHKREMLMQLQSIINDHVSTGGM
jgi:hypothetical protein